MLTPRNIAETILYASDLGAMERFYTNVLGLRKVSDAGPRGFALRVTPESVLLIFDPRETRKPHETVPNHGADGAGHIAFAVTPGSLAEWRVKLASHNIAIEREVDWERGGHSVYFRDPAGNSVELIDGDLWPT